MPKNKFGLERYIPAAVKYEVRRRCRFGCVICGSIIVDYEHFAPDFADARLHDPEGITLLCPHHHAKATRKFLSKEQIALADLQVRKSPILVRETFNWGQNIPDLRVGNITGLSLKPITLYGMPLLEFKQPDAPDEPLQLTAFLFNSRGEPSLIIKDNEWHPSSESNWDVIVSGGVISVFEEKNEETLRVRLQEPGLLHIETLKMRVGSTLLNASLERFEITSLDGTQPSYVIEGGVIVGGKLAIYPPANK